MNSKRVTFIHNPVAGNERQPHVGHLLALFKRAGYRIRYYSSKETGWTKDLKRSADIVAVAGGDGTQNTQINSDFCSETYIIPSFSL
jgi:diacylglycerol kinase family enzyme